MELRIVGPNTRNDSVTAWIQESSATVFRGPEAPRPWLPQAWRSPRPFEAAGSMLAQVGGLGHELTQQAVEVVQRLEPTPTSPMIQKAP